MQALLLILASFICTSCQDGCEARFAALISFSMQTILEEYLKGAEKDQSSERLSSQPPSLGLKDDGTPDPSGRRIAIDWKGDPMIINPGDNMPLF